MSRFSRQLGQSMTEYLVVLGVTGAALLATTTDVTRIFDNVDRSYSTQATEMNKVQLYKSHKVRFNTNDPVSNPDGGGTQPPPAAGEPLPAPAIPTIELVYDDQGNLLGKMKDGYLVNESGQPLAFCKRAISGECVFIDADGNIVFPGAGTDTRLVDDQGNDLPLMALVSGDRVYGFVYVYRDQFYSAADRTLLPQQPPAGFTAKPMRQVLELDENGVPHATGYELDGQLYSMSATVRPPAFNQPLEADRNAELVNVVFNGDPPGTWQGYKPCLVLPGDWRSGVVDFEGLPTNELTGMWQAKFNDPSLRLTSGGVGGFINASAGECGGASTVTRDPTTGTWSLM